MNTQDRKDEIKEINKLFWRANFDKKEWKIYKKHESRRKRYATLTGNPLDLNRI